MDKKLLSLIENDATLTADELAILLGENKEAVAERIKELEGNGTILSRQALIDWDKTDREYVTAFIEVKIQPQRDCGFDRFHKQSVVTYVSADFSTIIDYVFSHH